MNDSTEAIRLEARYRVLTELRGGGSSEVYVAVDDTSQLVVLKTPRRMVLNDAKFAELFRNEARLAARLHHPHVVEVFEVIEDQGAPVLVMEFLEGASLRELIDAAAEGSRPLPLCEHLELVRQTCLGLHYCHELCDFDGTPVGLVHRDVSPDNVFVTGTDGAKLLDFGIAKIEGRDGGTQTGTIKGKLRYMAPEQMVGGKIDRRADIYAVGVMLWEALTGRPMWGDQVPDVALMRRTLDGELPSPEPLLPDCTQELLEITMTCLAKGREDRFESCESLAIALEAAIAELPPPPYSFGSLVNDLFEERLNWLRGLATGDSLTAPPPPGPIHWRGNGHHTTTLVVGEPVAAAPPPKPQPQRRVLPAIGIGAALLLAGVSFARTMDREPTAAAQAPLPASIPASVPVSVPMPSVPKIVVLPTPAIPPPPAHAAAADPEDVDRKVRISILVEPSEAEVKLDGVVVPSPHELEVESDDRSHEIVVSAFDYLSQSTHVKFDRDVQVSMQLRRAPPQPKRRQQPIRRVDVKPTTSPTPPVAPPADPPATPPSRPRPNKDCEVPFLVDDRGYKQFKRECL